MGINSIFPSTLGQFVQAYTKGFPLGLRELGSTFTSNFGNRELLRRRFLMNGVVAFGVNYLFSTSKIAGDDRAEPADALRRASLLGGINFLGSMFLAAPVQAGFFAWARSEWTYGAVLPLSDIMGSLTPLLLLENEQNKDSIARKAGCVITIGGMATFFTYFIHKKLTQNGMGRSALGFSLLIGALHLAQSWWFTKKQTEHSGNPHLDIGRLTVIEVGTAAAQLLPLSLIPKNPAASSLWSADTMATNVSMTLRSLPSRGFGMTHFYAKMQDYNWLHAQIMNGIRIVALGLLFPTNQTAVLAMKRFIPWLFIGGQAVEMFFSAWYWTKLDRMSSGRVLAGKGQWKKETSRIPKLLAAVSSASNKEGSCAKLHDQMLQDMGSFDPRYQELMPDQVDFKHHETWLPNRKFTSMEDWVRELPDETLSIYGGALLACKPSLEREIGSPKASRGKRTLYEYLQPSYEIIETRREHPAVGCTETEG